MPVRVFLILLFAICYLPSAAFAQVFPTRDVVVFNVKSYGARGDGLQYSDGAITAADNTFTSASATFVAGDVGKTIFVAGAGAAGSYLKTTIATFTNANTVELTAAAGTTVSGAAIFTYGTDDTTAITNAITAATTGSAVYLPALNGINACYIVSGATTAIFTLTKNVTIMGDDRQYSKLCFDPSTPTTVDIIQVQNQAGDLMNPITFKNFGIMNALQGYTVGSAAPAVAGGRDAVHLKNLGVSDMSVTIVGNYFRGVSRNSIYLEGSGGFPLGVSMIQNNFLPNGINLQSTADSIWITHNTFGWGTGAGGEGSNSCLQYASVTGVAQITFAFNNCTLPGGLRAQSLLQGKVLYNQFEMTVATTNPDGAVVSTPDTGMTQWEVIGNNISAGSNAAYGIFVGATQAIIEGNVITGGSTNYIRVQALASAHIGTNVCGSATCNASNVSNAGTVDWTVYGAPTDDTVLVGTGNAWAAKALPDCDDTGGNHLNYDTGTNAFSCGTSGGGGAPTTAAYVTTQAEAGLSAEVSLGALTTGILKHTVAGAVSTPATAAAGTDYVAPGSITTSGLTQNTARLLGRSTASAGAVEEITIGANLTLSGGELSASGGASGYATVQDEGTGLTQRATVNFTGAGVSCADNAGQTRTDCTISGSGSSVVPIIQNVRLTLTSGTPVTTADVTGATNIYVTPHKGNILTFYDSATTWTNHTFTEQTIALGTLSAATVYDVFCWWNSAIDCFIGPAWSSATSRGTGAGTTELTTQNGVLVNAVDISGECAAKACTYMGSFYTTATTTTEDSAAKRLLYNEYNKVQRPLRATDSTSSWTYTTAAYRQANASATNQVEILAGQPIPVSISAIHSAANTGATIAVGTAIGEDSSTAAHAALIRGQPHTPAANTRTEASAHVKTNVPLGYHYYAWLETSGATGTTTWYGGSVSGLSGWVED